MLGWMKHKLESRLLREISITSDMLMMTQLNTVSPVPGFSFAPESSLVSSLLPPSWGVRGGFTLEAGLEKGLWDLGKDLGSTESTR